LILILANEMRFYYSYTDVLIESLFKGTKNFV